MENYYKIKQARLNMIAPVDVMGCYSIPNSVRDKKLYLLISLIISAQTRDEINFQTMLNLSANLQSRNIKNKQSNLEFLTYKVKYKIVGDVLYLNINNKIYKYQKKMGIVVGPTITLKKDNLNISKLLEETNLKELLKPAGFFNKKYETIKGLVYHIDKFGYPSTLEECLSIKGLGLKMSLLYLNKIVGIIGISVDTHVHRLCNLLDIVNTKNPNETSKILEKIIDKEEWCNFNNILVGYGQILCKPRFPRCSECVVNQSCKNNSLH